MPDTDYPTLEFANEHQWRSWLQLNYDTQNGVWLRLFKKASGIQTVTYAEALDQALCYGWIDGQRKSLDETSFLQKYTPRRPRSMWSKRNIEYVARLTASGQMTPAGQAQVDAAKADGRWDAAYDRQRDMTVPDDFLAILRQHPDAQARYDALNKSDLFAIGWRLQTAGSDATRQRRIAKLIATLEAGQAIR